MKLYSGPLSMFGAKAEIAAQEKGIDTNREFVPFSLATLYQPKHNDVLRINPKAQVPVLIDDGLEIFDSTQIFEYFEHIRPDPALWPTDPKVRAKARLLELKSDEVFFPNVVNLFPHNRTPERDDDTKDAMSAIETYYGEMNELVVKSDYLAGSYSYADIAFYMAQFFASFIGNPIPQNQSDLIAWRDRVGARPAVGQIVGTMRGFLNENGVPTDGF